MFSFYFKTTKKKISYFSNLNDEHLTHVDYIKLRKTFYVLKSHKVNYFSIAHYT